MVDHNNKRRKHHDKDKYYRLAKEQGFRSRAAFKLTQINRKFPVLQNSKVVLDLCAAPGGWTQVCSRTCSKDCLIVAVDILPIRSIGNNNVITILGDITTDSCKSEIQRELQNAPVDVVLCDGAPNVGASYDKDAYEQNELALHAMKCATQHLKRNGGVFITKLYRSRDYASYVWVAKQLFGSVQAVKPTASRAQSAEIFLVCQNYHAPTKIDPRLLDPKCIFEQVEGDSTGGGASTSKTLNVFHKQWNQQKRPNREGYDMEQLDATMRHIVPVVDFVQGKTDPIQLLSRCTGFQFQCEACRETADEESGGDAATSSSNACHCQFLLKHSLTTSEIKACVSDLKVLNKSDFKGLLTWRTKMREALKEQRERQEERESSSDDEEAGSHISESRRKNNDEMESEEEETQIQSEIDAMRQRRARERKKLKKKERALAAKRRRRAALGMDLNAIDVPEHDKIFSLATITSKGELEAAREVDLDKVTDEQLFGGSDEEENAVEDAVAQEGVESQGEEDDLDDETGYSYRLDRELDEAYDRYLRGTKNGVAKSGTKLAKRSKKLQRLKAMEEANEDKEMMLAGDEMIDRDTKTYAKMLQGQDSDDEEDSVDEEGDGFHEEPLTPAEHAAKCQMKPVEKEGNPLIHKLPAEPTSVKTARWFSNPLFESIGTTAQLAAMPDKKASKKDSDDIDYYSDEDDAINASSGEESEDEKPSRKKQKHAPIGDADGNVESSERLDAEEVLAMMPKTDKQIRHERRKKATERQERKKARKARKAGETDGDFEVAAAEDKPDNEDADEKLAGLSEKEKQKVLEARTLIKAGIGSNATENADTGFEVVSAAESSKVGQRPLPVIDTRKYDSEHEDYDSDDYAQTLALGTMMLRRSKAKALVDASYNRYAWNDPGDLPDWFVDDENRHYRPQLPIPPELVAKMKARMLALSTKPIAKVAEARARKSKRAKAKLTAAKKKAEVVANSSEMSEAMKLKAISKAMRGQDAKKPGKTYVVSKKGRGSMGGKGVKVVDKRMKNDKRSMERSAKKRKEGKRGALTGSKRRRSHG